MILIVPTCANYSDIVPVCVHYLDKFWSDCPYRKVIINGASGFAGYENYNQIDRGWIGNIVDFVVENEVTDNILLVCDDYILTQKVDQDIIAKADKFMADNPEIGCIRLVKHSDNKYNVGYGWLWESYASFNSEYNHVDIDRDYKNHGGFTRLPISLQPTIWSSSFIKKHFNAKWSPWQFEILGSREYCDSGTVNNVECSSPLLTVKKDSFVYCNAIRDGKYSRDFLSIIDKDDVSFKPTRGIADEIPCTADVHKLNCRQIDGTYPKLWPNIL